MWVKLFHPLQNGIQFSPDYCMVILSKGVLGNFIAVGKRMAVIRGLSYFYKFTGTLLAVWGKKDKNTARSLNKQLRVKALLKIALQVLE